MSKPLNVKGNLSDYRNRKLLVDVLSDRIIPQFTQRNYQLIVKPIQNFQIKNKLALSVEPNQGKKAHFPAARDAKTECKFSVTLSLLG